MSSRVCRFIQNRSDKSKYRDSRRVDMNTVLSFAVAAQFLQPISRRDFWIMQFMGLFQSTPPMREATQRARLQANRLAVSIHASHAGGDGKSSRHTSNEECFNPRLPCGRRRHDPARIVQHIIVSIHASHAGGDDIGTRLIAGTGSFNPRLPCGRRPQDWRCAWDNLLFQSTPPMREATEPGIHVDA